MSEDSFENRHEIEIFDDPNYMKLAGPLLSYSFKPRQLTAATKQEAFFLLSFASGCQHCQAHGGYAMHLAGVSDERIQAIWTFEQSEMFSEPEKAVYRFCMAAGRSPSEVTAELHAGLRTHYSLEQIRELLEVVAISGLLNRYNDAIAVVTDKESFDWAERVLSPVGWSGKRHRGDTAEQRKEFPHAVVEEQLKSTT